MSWTNLVYIFIVLTTILCCWYLWEIYSEHNKKENFKSRGKRSIFKSKSRVSCARENEECSASRSCCSSLNCFSRRDGRRRCIKSR
jgi:hypothetical protein